MQEVWKTYKSVNRWGQTRADIEVSNFGNVRGTIDGKPVKLGMVSGRHILCGRRLYYFVWELFNGPVPKGYVIHHKDHNKLNDALNNLELLTEFEHKSIHGKEKIFTEEYRKKISVALKGKKYKTDKKIKEKRTKEEINASISSTVKTLWSNPEYREKVLSSRKGKMGGYWYNNGIINKRFLNEAIIPEGFVKGKLKKCQLST